MGAVFSILSMVSACSADKQTGQTVKALFEKKCSTCHGLDRTKAKLKTQAEWTETVMRMKNKNGAPVNDDEAKAIIEHLAKNYGK
jgi:cytochrome c5